MPELVRGFANLGLGRGAGCLVCPIHDRPIGQKATRETQTSQDCMKRCRCVCVCTIVIHVVCVSAGIIPVLLQVPCALDEVNVLLLQQACWLMRSCIV